MNACGDRVCTIRNASGAQPRRGKTKPTLFAGAWEATFLRGRPRYRFLIPHAGSRAVKTNFAESRFENRFVVTVEDNPGLGLEGFVRAAHDGIVLDNCNTSGRRLAWRAMLQARRGTP